MRRRRTKPPGWGRGPAVSPTDLWWGKVGRGVGGGGGGGGEGRRGLQDGEENLDTTQAVDHVLCLIAVTKVNHKLSKNHFKYNFTIYFLEYSSSIMMSSFCFLNRS